MVTIRKTLKIENAYKTCEIELKQDGKCDLVVDNKVVAKYSSFENCLFNHAFLEFKGVGFDVEGVEVDDGLDGQRVGRSYDTRRLRRIRDIENFPNLALSPWIIFKQLGDKEKRKNV